MLSRPRDLERVRARLTSWLTRKMPDASELAVAPFERPSAGYSNETFLFDLSYRLGRTLHRERLVARLAPSDFLVFPEYDLVAQCRVMQRLAATPIPVPRVRWLEEDATVLGSPFYLMDAIVGDVPAEVPSYHSFGFVSEAAPERRARMWWSGIETLARIHALDWRALGLAFLGVPPPETGPLDCQLDYYDRYLRWVCASGAPQPILQAALSWLRRNRFVPAAVALCWGDSRMPNLMYRDDEVVGVLDWEMAFLGDPEEDLGWWLFMDWVNNEGYGLPRAAGFPDRVETIRYYEQLTGRAVEHALYHEVLAAFRFGVIMARIAGRLREIEAPLPTPDLETNNPCTQRLATVLGLPPPGPPSGGS